MTTTEPHPTRLKLGIALVSVAALFFSGASCVVRTLCDRFPTIQIVFIQNMVCLACILPFALRKGAGYLKTAHLPTHLLRDLFGVGSYFLFFLSIRCLDLVDATTLYYTAPFFVPFIWRIWRHEQIASNVWWSIVIGFFGVAMILQPGCSMFQLGFLYGLCAGIASAIAIVSVRVLNLQNEPLLRTLFYYFLISSSLSFPFACAVWECPTQGEWIGAIAIGLATVIGQVLLTLAYRYGTAAYLSPLSYTVVIYNALVAYFIFDQVLGWHTLIGTMLIILGGTLTFLFIKRPKTLLNTFEQSKNKPRWPPV